MFEHLLDHKAFFGQFRPREIYDKSGRYIHGITVCFNWTRFIAERWPLELESMQSHADLQRCSLPWQLHSIPITLAHVPARLAELAQKHQDGVRDYRDKLNELSRPECFPLPAYAIPDGRLFVMDGCHRLSAIVVASVPFHVEFIKVCGPVDPNCLPDLTHWASTP